MAPAQTPFHLMAKPTGPLCNLDCAYCFYLSKELLYPAGERFRMAEALLAEYVRQYVAAQPGPVISFAWQGGEPTLMGLPFFERVVALQRQFQPPGKRIENALQTNGTLLDDAWCAFFREHDFLIGLSLDGPADLHDAYRKDKGGKATHDHVVAAWRLLQRHGVAANLLCVVNRLNAVRPLEVYRYFKELGAEHMQFIPLVEPTGDARMVSERSVRPEDFGTFLTAVFDEWVRHDVGRIFIQTFEQSLATWLGVGPSLCVFQKRCGTGLVIEHNGDVYSCDHFVEQEHRLGNIALVPLQELVDSAEQKAFGDAKWDGLPRQCRECPVLSACHGECPKNRLLTTADGEPGLNYLCAGYFRYFTHVEPYMRRMAALIRSGRPADLIMQQLRAELEARFAAASRNDPCPCGSGLKYKRCCLPGRTG